MKKLVSTLIAIFCVAIFSIGILFFCLNNQSKAPIGSWWWNDELDVDTYLNFATENNVNEIYFCSSKFNESTKNFIRKANSNNIDVYWLAGEYKWLEDNSKLIKQIENYIKYQNEYKNAQFSGIHLDIEPHQSPNFKTNRSELIYNLIDLANNLKTKYPSIKFDYDLPFWLHDLITYNEQTKPAYEFMIDFANRVFIMSYRDTVEAILDISKEEIDYAKKQEKQLVLCVETYSNEGNNVSFKEEGKQVMQEEINKLKKELPKNFGIAIHHIKTWFELK